RTSDADNASLTDARGILPEPIFLRALCLERKRAERSRKRFVLMLLEAPRSGQVRRGDNLVEKSVPPIVAAIRETDIAGWHKEHSALGVIFAELGTADKAAILGALRAKMMSVVHAVMDAEQFAQITMTFHCFPDDWKPDG